MDHRPLTTDPFDHRSLITDRRIFRLMWICLLRHTVRVRYAMRMTSQPKFEIIPQGDGVCVKARGKTRAGLIASAMHGLFSAMKPVRPQEQAQKSEHPFAVEAATTEELLVRLLNEAIAVSREHGESCEELQFKLVTDTKAQGSFVGCAVTHFETPVAAAADRDLRVKKNEETGEWEAEICLER
jgi:SHS2 domain-containing protein